MSLPHNFSVIPSYKFQFFHPFSSLISFSLTNETDNLGGSFLCGCAGSAPSQEQYEANLRPVSNRSGQSSQVALDNDVLLRNGNVLQNDSNNNFQSSNNSSTVCLPFSLFCTLLTQKLLAQMELVEEHTIVEGV